MDTYDTFHDFLVNLFQDILTIEQRALITEEFKDISVNDMHIIEAIGEEEPKNMSTVARSLSVTVGTLTIAINNLVKKDYVSRIRSEKDRRVVLISLKEKGRRAFAHHKKFHEDMIQTMLTDMSEEETVVLEKTLINLQKYFRKFD